MMRKITLLVSILLLLSFNFLQLTILAQPTEEFAKLLASDGDDGDHFGYSVCISSNYAIIGSRVDNGSGSAYIFYNNAGLWEQQSKLIASDGEGGDSFGSTVSISGDYAIVGAVGDDDNGNNSGSAYIYYNNGGIWEQEAKLTPSDGADSDYFGVSVSISGDYAVIGAYGDDDNGSFSGSIYVFYNNGGFWEQQIKLTPLDGSPSDRFGQSVSISGNYTIVGAPYDNVWENYSGSAYIFNNLSGNWIQQSKLIASDYNEFAYFGVSVSISGDYAIVGEPGELGMGFGSAYVFENSSGSWQEQDKLMASDGGSFDYFGTAVAIWGETAIVGDPGEEIEYNGTTGSVYIFTNDSGTWEEQTKLIPSDGEENDYFGKSVSLSDDFALVGAYQQPMEGPNIPGYAYILGPQLTNNLSLSSLNISKSGSSYGSLESVTINISNPGLAAQSNFEVSYTPEGGITITETILTVIEPGGTLEYTFATTADLSAFGIFNVQACVNLSGDENPNNDCLSETIKNVPCLDDLYPLECNYHGITTWDLANVNIPTIDCSNSDLYNWYHNYTDLSHGLIHGQNFPLTVQCYDSPNYIDIWIDSNDDLLLSEDELIVNDFELTLQGINYEIPIFIPFDIPVGKHLMRCRTNWGVPVEGSCEYFGWGNVCDFSVIIDYSFTNNLALKSIIYPLTSNSLGNSEYVTVIISNYGSASQSNFDVSYSVDGGNVITETVSATIAPGEEFDYTFAIPVDLSAYQSYSIEACVNFSGDEYPDDDCKIKEIFSVNSLLCIDGLYTSGCSYGDGLLSWNLSNIDIPNIECGNGDPDWYHHYTNMTHLLNVGNDYHITTRCEQETFFDMWIDFDDDLIFTPDELIVDDYHMSNSYYNWWIPFNIPTDASEGIHLMRYRTSRQAGIAEPCDIVQYGNMCDFTIEIIGTDTFNITVFLEGPYNGTDMKTNLNPEPIPLSQPYNDPLKWNYQGTESVTAIPNADVVDWVLVELRETSGDASTALPDSMISQQAAFILKDGSIVGLDGTNPLYFDNEITDDLYVVVYHRNHLPIMSSGPLIAAKGDYTWDFTTAMSQAYGTDAQVDLGGGVFGMIGGDGNSNGQIEYYDKDSVWTAEAGNAAYLFGDFSLDKQADNIDKNDIWKPNLDVINQVPGNQCEPQPDVADAGPDTDWWCDDGATLSANNPVNGLGTWTLENGGNGWFDDINDPGTTFYGEIGKIYKLKWTISTQCASTQDFVNVEFAPDPTLANAGPDQLNIPGTQTILEGNSPIYVQYEDGYWEIISGEGGSFEDEFDPATIFYGVAGNTYELRWTIWNVCFSSEDYVNISFAESFVWEEVLNPITGKTWMDRNLGATRAALSSDDEEAYGDLYQWGRAAEGHEGRSSDTTSTNATTSMPNAGNSWDGVYIAETNSPYDWLTPQDYTLWQGIGGINNPCPTGFRLPTEAEWTAEKNSWSSPNAVGAFNSPLKLTIGGSRSNNDGSVYNAGNIGSYWSSSLSFTHGRSLYFLSSGSGFSFSYRASGKSVRCIKGEAVPNQPPAQPSNPSPQNGSTNIPMDATLTWDCSDPDGDNMVYNIYFGTETNPPLVKVNSGNGYNPGILLSNTNYYWRIVAYDAPGDSTIGDTWSFSTVTAIFTWEEVNNPITGETWMDRNLGAWQVATSKTDALAYGDLYQWGRATEGHEDRSSDTISTNATTPIPNVGNSWDGLFITSSGSPYDWLTQHDNTLWQGENGLNNPCPDGFRLPTNAEWEAERQSWVSNDADGAFGSPLKLTVGGMRNDAGALSLNDYWGYYWSSTVSDHPVRILLFYSSYAGTSPYSRVHGHTVRCIKGEILPNQPPTQPTNPSPQNGSTNIPTDAIISWDCSDPDGDNMVYNIYFGTETNPPLVTLNHYSNGYNPGILLSDTIYYWKIVAYDTPGDSTVGEVWSFGTEDNGSTWQEVTNPITGRTWMDRNLGAFRVALSSDDAEAYGDLYQWGRATEGHESRFSGITYTNATTATPNNSNSWDGLFITEGSNPGDWLIPQDNTLWHGTDGTNNPCPAGFRLPTSTEWNAERLSWSSNNAAGAFGSPLKLVVGGYRSSLGSLGNVGSRGGYWSCSVSGIQGRILDFTSGYSSVTLHYRARGASVRCIKEIQNNQPPTQPSIPLPESGSTNISVDPTLSWSCSDPEGDELTYNIYFGTEPNPPLLQVFYTNTVFNPGILLFDTMYYWKIVAYDISGDSTVSEIWSFGTIPFLWQEVTNPVTGRTWMDRNLGASRIALSSDDSEAYGDLYQWGRASEGHEKRTSGTTILNATTAIPSAGNSWDGLFILEGGSPHDWLIPQDNSLWQGTSGTNNPCPNGFRLPTEAEWHTERSSWSSDDATGAYNSTLKLTVGGYRSGPIYQEGEVGYYWSSSISGTHSRNIALFSNFTGFGTTDRVHGCSIRCIKDE